MPNKQRNFTIGLFIAVAGVLVLGIDRITVSADSAFLYGKSITIVTVVGLVILLVAAVWLFRASMEK